MKIAKWNFRINKLFLIILLLGLFLRLFHFKELFYYGHDHDLASWIIKDIVVDRHVRLIGQETSNHGVFIGALFYYALIPFYFLSNWDPIGGIWLSTLLGALTIISVYFVLSKIFSKNVGLISSFIYAISFLVVFTDREIVPTTPAHLWSVWFLYSISLILRGNQKRGFFLSAILMGLIWHINLSLLLLAPLIPLALLLSKKRIDLSSVVVSLAAFLFLLLPFVVFELRHDFQQVKSIILSLTSNASYIEGTAKGIGKWDRTMQLVYKNTSNIFYGPLVGGFPRLTLFVLVAGMFFLLYKKVVPRLWGILFIFWQMLFIVFFSVNSINLSEYYLNGMNIVWITMASLLLSRFYEIKKLRKYFFVFIIVFASVNLYKFFTIPVNQSGYLQRKSIVEFIKNDSLQNGYPCVSVSYITSPGNNFGYRYFFYLNKLHVNQPKSESPVYSIVFPHSLVDRIDNSFGALGLVLPEYEKYKISDVEKSCSGENANLTDPMLGFTK